MSLFFFFALQYFLKEIFRVIETLVKVWENFKKLWKHLPAAHVPTAFLILPNFHELDHGSDHGSDHRKKKEKNPKEKKIKSFIR